MTTWTRTTGLTLACLALVFGGASTVWAEHDWRDAMKREYRYHRDQLRDERERRLESLEQHHKQLRDSLRHQWKHEKDYLHGSHRKWAERQYRAQREALEEQYDHQRDRIKDYYEHQLEALEEHYDRLEDHGEHWGGRYEPAPHGPWHGRHPQGGEHYEVVPHPSGPYLNGPAQFHFELPPPQDSRQMRRRAVADLVLGIIGRSLD